MCCWHRNERRHIRLQYTLRTNISLNIEVCSVAEVATSYKLLRRKLERRYLQLTNTFKCKPAVLLSTLALNKISNIYIVDWGNRSRPIVGIPFNSNFNSHTAILTVLNSNTLGETIPVIRLKRCHFTKVVSKSSHLPEKCTEVHEIVEEASIVQVSPIDIERCPELLRPGRRV